MFFKKKKYFLSLCIFLMLFGFFLGLNSMHILMMWMSMEIMLMSFVSRLIFIKSISESYTISKYFIFQCLGSIFFILGSLDFFFFFLMIFGLIMKLGIFPNHFWMFMISKSLNWMNFYFLMSIQKLLPLMYIVLNMHKIIFLLFLIFLINSYVGNLGSLNQMDLRFLMIFSSMNHMTWMIFSSLMNFFYFYYYCLFYLLILFFLCFLFNFFNIFYFFQMFMKNYNFNYYLMSLCLIFFSFLGFPPLLGFFLKFLTLFSLLFFSFLFIFYLLLIQNLIISFSYIRIIIFFLFNISCFKIFKFNSNKLFYNFFIMLFFFLIN